jgi:hypothetical protein
MEREEPFVVAEGSFVVAKREAALLGVFNDFLKREWAGTEDSMLFHG